MIIMYGLFHIQQLFVLSCNNIAVLLGENKQNKT